MIIPIHVSEIVEGAFSDSKIYYFEIPDHSEIILIHSSFCELEALIGKISFASLIINPSEQQNIMMYDKKLILGKSSVEIDEYDVLLFCTHDIKEVTIPPFIKKIGSFTFSNSNIENITIPPQVT